MLAKAPFRRAVVDPPPSHQRAQPKRPCRMIEFVGTPGSGKSTIQRALREALVAGGHKPLAPRKSFYRWARLGRYKSPLTPIVLLVRVLAGGLGTWRYFFKTLWWCLAIPPSDHKRLGIALVLSAKRAELNRALRSCNGGFILYSEFLVNRVAKYIAMHKLSLQDNSLWFSNFYRDLSVLFVYVDTPVDKSIRRLESRFLVNSHVQKLGEPEATEYMKQLKRICELCVDQAVAYSGGRVVRVSGVDSIEITIEHLLSEAVEMPEDGPTTTMGNCCSRLGGMALDCRKLGF